MGIKIHFRCFCITLFRSIAILCLLVVTTCVHADLLSYSLHDWKALTDRLESIGSFETHSNANEVFAKYGPGLLLSRPNMAQRNETSSSTSISSSYSLLRIPHSYDVRTSYPNCTSPVTVYDQGSCGGCWSISVASSLSDRYCVSNPNSNVVLSPQDLLDCVETGSTKGCNGGFAEDGFDYVSDEGIHDLSCVPFKATDGFCSVDLSCTKYRSSTYSYVPPDEDKIRREIWENGSVSAVFEVFADFFAYKGGVYSHVDGDYAGLHAVTLTGWGTMNGVDHWIVRNSYGDDFGYNGYFYIARGVDNNGCNFEGGVTTAKVFVNEQEIYNTA